MKSTLILVFVFLLSINLFASDKKSFVSLRSGLSLPIGDYSKNDLDEGCFTNTGVSFGAEGAWFFWKNFGVGLDVNYSLHVVDAIGLAQASVAIDPFVSDLTVRSEPYTMLTLLGGVYYSYSLTKRINIQPKILGGLMYGKTPFQLYEPTLTFPGPSYYKTTSAKDRNLAFKTGLGINYQFNENVALGLSADYTHSFLVFGFRTAGNNHEYRNRNISYVDLGINLIIKL